ncbi:MAG: class I SAM-dependent methyltransferase [Phototrophicaceae bacterium]
MTDSRDMLLQNYDKRIDLLDPDIETKLSWFRLYIHRHYMEYLQAYETDSAQILDIGCSRGYSLRVFQEHGFSNLKGIDVSCNDIEAAKKIVPEADFECTDVFEYLQANPQFFDIILIKAVLEHIPKNQVIPLLQLIKSSLKPNGIVLVDVPNMDWLFATHERYMDFTHEVGFTKESMAQLLGLLFNSYKVKALDNGIKTHWLPRLKTNFARMILGTLLRWADYEGAHNPIWARSLLGIGQVNDDNLPSVN